MASLWRSVTMGGMTRLKQLSMLNRGYKYKGESSDLAKYLYRNPDLEIYTRYMENTQYDHLPDWNADLSNQQNDTRQNKPKKIFPLPRIACNLFSSMITSEESQLEIRSEDENKQELIDKFLKDTMFWAMLDTAFKSFFANGSVFIRFYISPGGKLILSPQNTKSCWPTFDEDNELDSVVIRYIYDTGEVDTKNKPIWEWAQYLLSKDQDIEYDNPRYDETKKESPIFKEKEITAVSYTHLTLPTKA